MRTLLVPTDFDLSSLDCVPSLISKNSPQKLNILLVHLMGVTDNIGELLMLSRRSAEYKHIPQEFYNRCAELKRAYADQLENIDIKFFYGNTVVAFKNFLEMNGVDTIVLLKNYDYQKLTKTSIEPELLTNRSGMHVAYVDSAQTTAIALQPTQEELVEETA